MSNLPIEKKKLNIWQRINVKLYLLRNYDPIRFEKAPDYIKQDDNVLEKMIEEEIYSKGIKSSNRKILIDLFRNKPYLFKNETREQIIDYAMREREYDIISNLSTEEQYNIISCEEYTSYEIGKMLEFASIDVVKLLIEKKSNEIDYFTGKQEYKPKFLKYCNNEVQLDIISENNEFIQYANTELQVQLAKQDNSKIELINKDAQREFLEGNTEFLNNHSEYTRIASEETQLLFASQNKEKLRYIDEKLQLDIISKRPQAFDYASETIKSELFNSKKFKYKYYASKIYQQGSSEIVNSLLNYDMKYFKYIGYDKDFEIVTNYLESLSNNIINLDNEKIKNIFIKSGILDAMGSLRKDSSSLYYGYDESVSGEEIYQKSQLDVIQSLNVQQIGELIKIDSNFIMPYVIDKVPQNHRYDVDEINIELNKDKCKQVFKEIYGEEKLSELEICIDDIFDEQVMFQKKDLSYCDELMVTKMVEYEKPLESLKLLFNNKIIENNSPELIKKYYSELFSEEKGKETFKQIILNTYGDKATKILDNREQLDVYAINSLEIFDKRILENFSEEFVNDLISYNIRDFSSFLNIIKNNDELTLFKEYYDLLSKTIGKNVETMQKAISEFYYNKNLLENIKNLELTEEQYTNLLSVICGEKNEFDIANIEQLENFDEIAKKKFQERLSEGFDVKEEIVRNLFGMDLYQLENLLKIYDLEELENMSIDEKEIMRCLEFIINENDKKQLEKISNQLINTKGIRNPIALHTGIEKIKEYGIEYLKNRMLTKEKLDAMCEGEEKHVKKENIDGVEVYYIQNVNYLVNKELGFLGHHAGLSYGRNLMDYEGQAGMSTISARLYFDGGHGRLMDFLFTDIESEDLLAYSDSDANTHHSPKLVKSKAYKNTKIKDKLIEGGNEVAFYRRTRNHDKRKKENPDGRIKPTYIACYNGISQEKLEYAKKYNIPIVILHPDKENEIKEGENIDNGEER